MSNYKFNEDKTNQLTNATEPMSAIAAIVYEVENVKYNGVIATYFETGN